MSGPSLGAALSAVPTGGSTTDPLAVALASSRLVGRRCRVTRVLSRRRLPSGATVLVVSLETPDGTALVAKSGPPHLISAGVLAQGAAAASSGREDGVLRVPRLLADEPGLAVSACAPGVPLSQLARLPGERAVRLAGRALAELSHVTVEGRARGIADHLAELVTPHPDALALTGLPEPAARAVRRAARAALAAEVAGATGLVHRDVHPRQLLVDGSRIWLLDWDLAARADPALDLANLIQHTRFRLPAPVADRVVHALLEGYAPSSAVLHRLPALEAFTAVRLACKAARLHGAAAASTVTVLVARARSALEMAGRHG